MRDFFRRLAGRAAGRYRKMSIQMVISLSFTAVAVVGMLFMGGSLYLWMSGTASAMVEESSQKVLAQVNLNLDSYLRRMMRVSDAMYYRVIKNTDLATGSLQQGMDLLYEENRDALVSIALFDGQGRLVQATPLARGLPPRGKRLVPGGAEQDGKLPLFGPPCAEPLRGPHLQLSLGGVFEPVCPAHPGRRHRERGAAGGYELCGHRAGLPVPEGGSIAVWVQDAGPGMSQEVQLRIFEQFYQADPSHATAGNGLGLAMAKKIVALHGGQIQVDSSPGQGSRFTVLLPAMEA